MPDHIASLFSPLTAYSQAALNRFEQLLHTVLSPKPAHLKALPVDIADLSSRLTTHRQELSRPYWADARLKNAYLWYFLPWNLVRLVPLLAGLPLRLNENAHILDLGSGPLTLPLALWLARPDLHATPLTFHCNDIQPNALSSGLALFNAQAAADGQAVPAWKIKLHKGGLNEALRLARGKQTKLVTALNVLNELKPDRRRGLRQTLDALTGEMRKTLGTDGQILLVEPGNRLGGRIIETARECAGNRGLLPSSPCPHNGPCPVLNSKSGAWCHFVQENQPAPHWLLALSAKAHLAKTHTALSFLLLDVKKEQRSGVPHLLPGRIISNPFSIAEEPGPACYACTRKGLALVLAADALRSGSLPVLEPTDRTDLKSGAFLARTVGTD